MKSFAEMILYGLLDEQPGDTVEEMSQNPGVPQSGQQGMPQPPVYAPPPPPRGLGKRPKGPPPIPAAFLAICIIGLLVMTCGLIVQTSATFLVVISDDLFSEPEYDKNLVKNVTTVGKIIAQIGAMVLAMGLLSAGFLARDISANARMGLFIAAGLVVGLFFGLSSGMTISTYY